MADVYLGEFITAWLPRDTTYSTSAENYAQNVLKKIRTCFIINNVISGRLEFS